MEGSFGSDGQVRISGRDFTGMAASGCYKRGKLSCLSCHSLHNYQDASHQLGRDMESNQSCYQCHGDYAAKLEQHTHHRAGSSGSLCYNCHMPHTSYGLLKAIRSHTINSPSVQSSLDTGRPNACNLCHLDKSLGWTAARLNEWHRQPSPPMTEDQRTTSAGITWLLKGDAGQRSLIAWHMGWESAKTISGQQWMPRFLAETLVDPYANVRYLSQRSLKAIPGFESFAYDYIGLPAHRAEARQRALDLWKGKPALNESSVTFPQPDVLLQEDKVAGMIRQRDDRRMELLE